MEWIIIENHNVIQERLIEFFRLKKEMNIESFCMRFSAKNFQILGSIYWFAFESKKPSHVQNIKVINEYSRIPGFDKCDLNLYGE